jgi:hypothetical protein
MFLVSLLRSRTGYELYTLHEDKFPNQTTCLLQRQGSCDALWSHLFVNELMSR